MEYVVCVLLGIGLSAACGFRVFLPLLAVSVAGLAGWIELTAGFGWLGTWPALVIFAVATVLEIVAYYVPWLDNLLDSIATPTAVIAGVLVSVAVMTRLPPAVRWTLAVIAGGGIAGIIQAATVAIRGASTAATGGAANPVAATAEVGGATGMSVLSIAAPAIAGIVAVFVAAVLAWLILRLRRRLRGQCRVDGTEPGS